MKKYLSVLMLCASLVLLDGVAVYANRPDDTMPQITANRAVVNVTTIQNGRALVSVREIAEVLGLHVQYVPSYKQVFIYDEGTTIIFRIGYKAYTVNSIETKATVAPMIYENQTVLPVRVIAEAFGLDISYDAQTRQVSFEIVREYTTP